MLRTGLSRAVGLGITATVLFGVIASASAQKAAVLAAVRSYESAWAQYLQRKVIDTALYPDGVDYINVGSSTPSLAQLSAYKLLVVMSNDYGLGSGYGMGSVLGDYMAMVPGASVLLFLPYTWQTGLFSAPAIADKFLANYPLTTQTATSRSSAAKRGMVVGNDPLVDGVTEFTCGSNCTRVTGIMPVPGATVAAYWDDGTILAVRGNHRVDLNMMPVDESIYPGSFKAEGGALITNAILYLGAALLPSPSKLTFPATPLGSSSTPITVTFKNSSKSTMSITGISVDGADKLQFTFKSAAMPTVASPLSLSLGSSFTVEVRYKPQAQGTHRAALNVDIAGLPRATASLEGTSKGNLYVLKSPVDFGGIATGATAGPVTVRLLNVGTSSVDVDKPVLADTTHYELNTPLPDAKVTLFSGASYPFTVKFVPGMTPGQFMTQITVTSTDASSPLIIPVLGMAGPPKLQVAYASLVLPDVPLGAMGLPMNILLTNTGNSELSVNTITSSANDFVVPMAPSDMNPLRIAARDSTTFQLVFTPQDKGLRTGTLTIKSNEPPAMGMMNSDKTINLVGTGTVPKFRVDPAQLDFGNVTLGMPLVAQSVTLYNDGDGDLQVKDVAIPMGMYSSSFAVNLAAPVPFVLHAGASVPVSVSFAPKESGMLSASLRLVSDITGMGGTAMVALKGAANGAIGQVSPVVLDFGDQKLKAPATKTLTITNKGNQPLTLLHARLVQTAMAFSAMLPSDNTKVMMGANLPVNVTVTCSNIGAATGRVELDSDDPAMMGGTRFVVNLTANCLSTNVSVMPNMLDFSPPIYVGQRSTMGTVTVKNTGSVPIDNLVVKTSGQDAADFWVAMNFKTRLMPGDSTDLGFVFEPHIAKFAHTATAVIEADGIPATMMVALKGSSMSAMLGLQPDALHFDSTVVGEQSPAKSVVLSNDGTQRLELEVVPPASSEFVVDTSQSNLTLNPGDVTKLAVVFAPQSTGNKSDSFAVRLKGANLSIVSVAVDGQAIPASNKGPMTSASGCMTSRGHTGWFGLLLLLLAVPALWLRRRKPRSG